MLRRHSRGESGQVLIFFAVLAPVLFAILGLAVEGGLTFFEYRHMQSAADMAALVGAQDLPDNVSQAVNDACLFSQNNGYDNCATSGSSTTTVCAPPNVLSPYNGLNYQEGATACANSGKPNYIEVTIQKPVQLFPIFSQYLGLGSFTLSAHAVARHGTPSKVDYAISILEKTSCPGLTLSGSNPVIVVGPVISDCNAANSISTGGSKMFVACNGQWLVSGPELYPPLGAASNLRSQTGGTAAFSPTDCLTSGNYDAATAFTPDVPPIPDPYCTTLSPPTGVVPSTTGASTDCTSASQNGTMTNCLPCNGPGAAWYYTWPSATNRNSGNWQQAPNGRLDLGSGNWELFPGVYPGGIKITTSNANIYFNPGVYTIEGNNGIDAEGGNVCIYGAPACDVGVDVVRNIPGTTTTCPSANMTNSGDPNYVLPDTWYYYCSPWGIWDSNPCLGYNGSGTCTPTNGVCPGDTVHCHRPSVLNGSTGVPKFTGTGQVHLNGVTFYFTGGGGFKLNGGNVMYLAFPNPCPGTGAETTNSVPFRNEVNPTATGAGQTGWPEPSGASGGVYNYPSGSLPNLDGISNNQSSSTDYVYPNVDLTLNGECERYTTNTYAGDVWPGEMPSGGTYQGQHLHFLFFARDGNSSMTLNGGGGQTFFGILYDPGVQLCGNACQVKLNGSSTGGGGPPFLMGQIVANNATITGHSTVEVFYRPCDPAITECGTGPGSGLVQ